MVGKWISVGEPTTPLAGNRRTIGSTAFSTTALPYQTIRCDGSRWLGDEIGPARDMRPNGEIRCALLLGERDTPADARLAATEPPRERADLDAFVQ